MATHAPPARETAEKPTPAAPAAAEREVAQAATGPAPGIAHRIDHVPLALPGGDGLPKRLRAGIEAMSGLAMDDVKVHRNSARPRAIGAHAFTQGSSIHLAPGQDRHLPHEAWHVVQQKQRRVKANLRTAGVSINDDAGLEHEADVMGARASSYRGAPAAPAVAQAAPPALAPVQGVWVKLVSVFGGAPVEGKPTVYRPAKASDPGAVDTKTMTLSQRQRVRGDLSGDKKYKATLDELNNELNAITGKVDEKELLGISETLAGLSAEKAKNPKLSEKSEALLTTTSFRLYRALDFLGSFDQTDSRATRYRVLIQSYFDQIAKLDANALKVAAEHAEDDADLNVSADDVAAYRADIRDLGVWGSGAEARAVATAFNFRTRLLILDSDDQYVEVDTVGAGALSPRSLLNVGNHYVVVGNGAVAGQAHDAANVLYEPDPDGDCLFSALFNVANNGANVANVGGAMPANLDRDQFIVRARELASTNLSQAEIEQTIVELRLSGARGGVGKRLAARMNVHGAAEANLRAALDRTGCDDAELYNAIKDKLGGNSAFKTMFAKNKSLGTLLKSFEAARAKLTKAPKDSATGTGGSDTGATGTGATGSSAPAKKASASPDPDVLADALNQFVDATLAVVAEKRPDLRGELVKEVGQDPDREAAFRRDALEQHRRAGVSVTPSSHNQGQFIIKKGKTEFVLDRIGQLVPRFVSRGISDFNVAELDRAKEIYPTADSPVPKGGYSSDLAKKFGTETAKAASGTRANKVKASVEMLHVEGMKPSPFMSTTAKVSGTANPKGETFGSKVYRIDLAYLPPSAIAATYTDRGMGYYLLSAYEGSDKAKLIAGARTYQAKQQKVVDDRAAAKAKKQKAKEEDDYTGENAAKEDATLSGKEWQALMDVVRTEEILIRGKIPGAAMSQPKADEKPVDEAEDDSEAEVDGEAEVED